MNFNWIKMDSCSYYWIKIFDFFEFISVCWDRGCNTSAQLCYIRCSDVDNHIHGRWKRKTLL